MLTHFAYCHAGSMLLFGSNTYVNYLYQNFKYRDCNSVIHHYNLRPLSLRLLHDRQCLPKYYELHLVPHRVFMFHKVLRTTTNYFHKQHFNVFFLATLNKRQELNFCHQIIVICAEIISRYCLKFLLQLVIRYNYIARHYTQVAWADMYKVRCGFTGFVHSSGIYIRCHVFNWVRQQHYR